MLLNFKSPVSLRSLCLMHIGVFLPTEKMKPQESLSQPVPRDVPLSTSTKNGLFIFASVWKIADANVTWSATLSAPPSLKNRS